MQNLDKPSRIKGLHDIGIPDFIVAILYMIAARAEIRTMTEVLADPVLPKEKGAGWKAFRNAFWGLLAPVIILGGIYSGLFTATESAVAAVVYSLIIGFFVYRELTLEKLVRIVIKSAISSAIILLLIGTAQLCSWVLAIEGIFVEKVFGNIKEGTVSVTPRRNSPVLLKHYWIVALRQKKSAECPLMFRNTYCFINHLSSLSLATSVRRIVEMQKDSGGK